MLLFIASKLYFFFLPTLAVPRRLGQAALSQHLLVCTLCSEFTLPRSKELQGFELQPQLKDNAAAVACDFEILNLFLVLKGALTRHRMRLSFFFSLQFFFFFRLKSNDRAHFICPLSACSSLLVDCRGVKHALFLYGCCTSYKTTTQFLLTIYTYVLFVWYQIFVVHLLSCDAGKPLLCMSDTPRIPAHVILKAEGGTEAGDL